jgi:hypothetical protein
MTSLHKAVYHELLGGRYVLVMNDECKSIRSRFGFIHPLEPYFSLDEFLIKWWNVRSD